MAAPPRDDALLEEVRALSRSVGELQREVRALATEPAKHGWEDDERERDARPGSYAWVSELRPPLRRNFTVPRFLLEAGFLIGAAALAAAAELEVLEIAAAMAVAWAIVVLSELLASRAERRRDELLAPPPVVLSQPSADPAWFAPPVEHTLLEGGAAPDSETAVTRLPPVADVETTAERKRS